MIASTGAAAAAIAAQEQLRQQEEEEMTPYSPNDLNGDWEFKILRSPMGAFSQPERLRAILEEEKQGGWVLVEVFDSARIRLKRPAGVKIVDDDFQNGYNPYRTYVPIGQGTLMAWGFGVLGLFLVTAILVLVVVGFQRW